MTVCTVPSLIQLSQPFRFLRFIFLLFFNDLKLLCSWLIFEFFLSILRHIVLGKPGNMLWTKFCNELFLLVVIEVHVLHLSERHVLHITANVRDRTSTVILHRCRVWWVVKLLLRPIHHVLLLFLVSSYELLAFQIIRTVFTLYWHHLDLLVCRRSLLFFSLLQCLRIRINFLIV